MLIKIILALVLVLMINQWASAISVNETVGDFRIRFEAKDDINMIAKVWNQMDTDGPFNFTEDSPLDVKDVSGVLVGDMQNESNTWSGVVVIIMGKPIHTTDAENEFFKNSSESYIRVYDRTIDGHSGIYALTGDGPEDSAMTRMGLYWLDEATNGTASELIMVMSDEAEPIAETMINTVHVERMAKH